MADDKPLPEILVFGPPTIFPYFEKRLSTVFRILKPWESPLPLPQFLAGRAQNTQAAICGGQFTLSAALLCLLPSLRMIFTTSAGLNHIDPIEFRSRGIDVAYAATIFSGDVADLAVGLLLDVQRKISSANRFVNYGLWPDQGAYPLGSKLGGKRVGIVGLGSIGLEVAKRLEAFGCEIAYHSRTKRQHLPYLFCSTIHDLAATSHVLVLCCALTKETHHIINREVMLALGKDGVIVNIARGGVIDEKELVACLQRGEVGGAGLDVFEHEPCPSNELYKLDNVVLTPHAAVFTEESMRDLYELMVANLGAFFSNRPLISPIPDY